MRRSRSADQAKFFCVFQSNGGKHEASVKRESRARGEEQKKTKQNKTTTPIVQAIYPPTPLQSPTNHSIQKKSGVKRFVHRPHVWPIIKRPSVKTVFVLRAYLRRSLPKYLKLRGNRTMKTTMDKGEDYNKHGNMSWQHFLSRNDGYKQTYAFMRAEPTGRW